MDVSVNIAEKPKTASEFIWVSPEWQLELCGGYVGFVELNRQPKRPEGYWVSNGMNSSKLGVIKGDYSITVGQLGINDGAWV